MSKRTLAFTKSLFCRPETDNILVRLVDLTLGDVCRDSPSVVNIDVYRVDSIIHDCVETTTVATAIRWVLHDIDKRAIRKIAGVTPDANTLFITKKDDGTIEYTTAGFVI